LTYNPTAKGVIAANRLSMAPLDGELLGVLPMTALITRVIEERTPYLLTDFDPVVLTPGDTYVLLASREAKFDRLNQVNPKNLTLYHNGLDPISPGALLALAVMKSQGGFPNLVETEVLTPDILAHDPNATLAWSLHQLDAAAPAKGYKIVAVLTENYSGPCAPPKMDLQSQGLKTQVHNYLGFYYPHRTIQAEKETLAQALVATLDDPQAKELAQKMCLAKTNQDSLSLPPNQAVRLLGLELAAQTGLMESLKADHE
jgi:tripartite-type tricarboxylate transporter receptor subunit TctC